MKSPAEILETYRQRQNAREPWIRRASQVRDAYQGSMVVPLPELSEAERAAVPNLVNQGVDQTAMRIASVMPSMDVPPRRPGIKTSEKEARERRRAVLGYWERSLMDVMLRRRARHLIAYGSSVVVIRPDAQGDPTWHLRDPLTSYCAPGLGFDTLVPPDAIFTLRRSREWLRYNHPEAYGNLNNHRDRAEKEFTLLEYVDHDEISLFALGSGATLGDPITLAGPDGQILSLPGPTSRNSLTPGDDIIALTRLPNRSGRCPVAQVGRITLGNEMGQFDGILGMYQAQAMLFALEFRAVVDGVWPNEWLVGRENETPRIVRHADGRRGEIGQVEGGVLQTINRAPSYMAGQMIDRLERNARVDAGLPADFGGESSSNVRTGRRAEVLLSAVSDFRIQEAQLMLARSLEEESRIAMAVANGYRPNAPRSFYVTWSRARGQADFTPAKLFTSDRLRVYYPFAGADINNLTIGIGQRKGLGMMSNQTAMELDPYIDDPEVEKDRLASEALDRALETSILEAASAGTIPPADVARIAMLVRTDRYELAEAVEKVQREAQLRQSTTEEPVAPGSPEAMPGLAQPGMGAEAGVAVPEVEPNMANLASQLRALYPGQAAARLAASSAA